MGKQIITFILCFLLASCAWMKPKTVYITSPIPEPPAISRPVLLTNNITPSTTDGDVVKFYRATIVQLLDYSSQLEAVVDKYRVISKNSSNGKTN